MRDDHAWLLQQRLQEEVLDRIVIIQKPTDPKSPGARCLTRYQSPPVLMKSNGSHAHSSAPTLLQCSSCSSSAPPTQVCLLLLQCTSYSSVPPAPPVYLPLKCASCSSGVPPTQVRLLLLQCTSHSSAPPAPPVYLPLKCASCSSSAPPAPPMYLPLKCTSLSTAPANPPLHLPLLQCRSEPLFIICQAKFACVHVFVHVFVCLIIHDQLCSCASV